MVEKFYSESYAVDANATVDISNQFGEISVTSWDRNDVVIKVEVRVEGDDKKFIQRQLNGVNVFMEGSQGFVRAKTKIEEWARNATWMKETSNYDLEINYIVKMPATCNLDIDCKFGDCKVDNLKGEADISLSYGTLDIGALYNNDNQLTLRYSQGCEINYIQAGKIELDNTDIEIGSGNAIELMSKYSDAYIEEMDALEYYGKHDAVVIRRVQDLKVFGRDSDIKVKSLGKTVEVDMTHGKLYIDRVQKDFDKVQVENKYGPVLIEFDAGANYAFNAKCKYSGVTCPNNATITTKEKDNSSSQYAGYVGTINAVSKVVVDSQYGNVKLKVIE